MIVQFLLDLGLRIATGADQILPRASSSASCSKRNARLRHFELLLNGLIVLVLGAGRERRETATFC